MFNAKNNKNKIEAKDVLAAKSYGTELEEAFHEQQKLLKRVELEFECEKCHTKIQVSEGRRRPTCPNEKCLARYHVEFVYPAPEGTLLDSSYKADSIQPITTQLTDDIIIPDIRATFRGYAYESRVNYPSADCSNEQLFARISTAAEKLQFVADGSKESILLDLIELIKRSLKE